MKINIILNVNTAAEAIAAYREIQAAGIVANVEAQEAKPKRVRRTLAEIAAGIPLDALKEAQGGDEAQGGASPVEDDGAEVL
jgi:hypothetical protein